MKRHASLTLTDLSPAMLELSRALNPECEHIEGDMTSLRLDRTFDAVFVHDAVSYLTTETELRAAIETAWEHFRPGGAVLLEPDHTRESFAETNRPWGPRRRHDGIPDDGRSLRYLQWTLDPDPTDTWYFDEFAYLLRDRTNRCERSPTGTGSGCSRRRPGSSCSVRPDSWT